MKLLLTLIIGLSVSGCVMNEASLSYPEVDSYNVVWINGISYYYVSPGVYYRVIVRGGQYLYWGTNIGSPHLAPHQGVHHHGFGGHGIISHPHFRGRR
jgi:hypothetical protein